GRRRGIRATAGRDELMERAVRPATLGDVARLAGVSMSTVSNVVRGATVVAPRTRRRVQSAIDQLGYRPNALARHLLQGRATNGQIPAVFIAAEEPWADSVTVDEQRGGEIVARHLIGLGHRRLAFVGPQEPDRADARRLDGFLRAAADAGLQPKVIAWDPPDG